MFQCLFSTFVWTSFLLRCNYQSHQNAVLFTATHLELMFVLVGAPADPCKNTMPIVFPTRFSRLKIWARIFWSVHTVKESSWDGRKGGTQWAGAAAAARGEKDKRCFDWQLSGLVPAEVVPPVDCYYQQKDFPIVLAGTVVTPLPWRTLSHLGGDE